MREFSNPDKRLLKEYSHITTMFVKEDGYHMTEKTKILSQKALPFRALVFG